MLYELIVVNHLNVLKAQKLKSTYVDGLLAYVKNNELHTNWDHTAAATGRLTSCNPNVQAIPKLSLIIPDEDGPCTSFTDLCKRKYLIDPGKRFYVFFLRSNFSCKIQNK